MRLRLISRVATSSISPLYAFTMAAVPARMSADLVSILAKYLCRTSGQEVYLDNLTDGAEEMSTPQQSLSPKPSARPPSLTHQVVGAIRQSFDDRPMHASAVPLQPPCPNCDPAIDARPATKPSASKAI